MESVGKRRGAGWIVRDVTISIRPGELYTLLGPPGAGKTAILRMVAGLDAPDAGRIFIDDELVDPVPPGRRNVGMVFAQSSLWPHLTVFDNVAFGLRVRGHSTDVVSQKVKAVLARMGLDGLEGRRPSDLSSGQPERVALARALVVEPRLLLLDEPLGRLDPALRSSMGLELMGRQREAGITTLWATRDRVEALTIATRIGVLSGGAVIQEGKPEEIYWQPRSRSVAELVGAANLIPVRVVELRPVGVVVETAGGAQLPVAAGGHTWEIGQQGLLCLRPEALAVEESALAPGGIAGTVASMAFEGPRQRYEIDIAGGLLRLETVTSARLGRSFKPGDEVKVEVLPETSVLLPDD
jgi:ABC-type Fe3+/spermidine/putrescine transport system ATPase subunit